MTSRLEPWPAVTAKSRYDARYPTSQGYGAEREGAAAPRAAPAGDGASRRGEASSASLVTAAAMAGVSERIIMLQTGHKNIAVLQRYIREGSVFRENAAAAVGL
jgi:hypothetical protein